MQWGIHYAGEIGLKGGNRSQFEARLRRNIQISLHRTGYNASIRYRERRILVEIEGKGGKGEKENPGEIEVLGRIFGIEWFAPTRVTERSMDAIEECIRQWIPEIPEGPVRVEARRTDKTFPLTSPQINAHIGQRLSEAGFPIDLEKPRTTVRIEILPKEAWISVDQIRGAAGLPAGTAGRVLTLLSGGIDSPVAAWLMMRRGCLSDFLHIHPYPDSNKVNDSKIIRILRQLGKYSPVSPRLYVAGYSHFYAKTTRIPSRYELVLFRRFMMRLAGALAKQKEYKGIVTGDSLAQVASQTLENLQLMEGITSLPSYRPLIAYDKEEIIRKARSIGTFEASIEDYRDCCSLVSSPHPATRAKEELVRKLEEEIAMEEIVEKTLRDMEEIEVD